MLRFYFILLTYFSMARVVASLSKNAKAIGGENLLIIPLSAPIEFRFNDSAKLKEHMPRPARSHVDIINWLAERYQFTYSICETNETTFGQLNSRNKGAISYLLDKTCDMVVSDLMMTNSRYELIDMPYPWAHFPVFVLIPAADDGTNVAAILKPFQFPVWILAAVSVVAVVVALMAIHNYILSTKSINENTTNNSPAVTEALSVSYLYVIGILVNQGGRCVSKRLVIRLVVGSWCLVAFFLGQAYNSTLITYVIAHNGQPLINSIHDVANNPDIHVLVEKGWAMDILFGSSTEKDGIFKVIRDRINAYPDSRCTETEYVKRIRSGGPYISPQPKDFILDIMLKDFQQTGECRMQIAKESFMNTLVSFALKKGSRYTKLVSEGILEMNAFGLVDHYIASNRANPHKCLKQVAQKQSTHPRLSLNNLTGAFVVLLVGWGASLIAFIAERLHIIQHLGSRIGFHKGQQEPN